MSLSIEEAVITSVKGLNWQINQYDPRQILAFGQKLDLPEVIARILLKRGITIEHTPDYLAPTLKKLLPDPMHLLDMNKAALRLANAVKKQEQVVIFGDYDVDGATSSALLKRFFASVGLSVGVYIPDRIKEGYGPNGEAFRNLKKQGTQIIITVDCGTAAFDALETAAEIGLEVIVIDHHLGSEILPKAVAIVNPNRLDETSPYKYLAAVGVSFLLAVAVNSTLREQGFYQLGKEPSLLNLLDLVALGTVCDIVPLEGLNRAFVVQGLKILAKRNNLGLAVLADVVRLSEVPGTYHLGFVLGPRINAGGRVGESDLGSRLMTTEDCDDAQIIAKQLDHYNAERKAIETLVLDEAMLAAEQLSADSSVIFVAGSNWHPGVIGIVASRLKEKFNKPTAIVSLLENGIGKASCRSVKGVDFGSSIFAAKALGLVIEGGGHAMAAGFSVAHDKVAELHQFLDDKFKQDLSKLSNQKHHYFDGYLSCNGINLELANLIERVGPFGANAPEPRFMLNDCLLFKVDIIAGAHISCILGHKSGLGSKSIKATAFRAIDTSIGKILLSSKGRELNIIGYLRINRWNGTEKAEFIIEDVLV